MMIMISVIMMMMLPMVEEVEDDINYGGVKLILYRGSDTTRQTTK